jgi:hypothetical protein
MILTPLGFLKGQEAHPALFSTKGVRATFLTPIDRLTLAPLSFRDGFQLDLTFLDTRRCA